MSPSTLRQPMPGIGEFVAGWSQQGSLVYREANEALGALLETPGSLEGKPVAQGSGASFDLGRCIEECASKGMVLTRRLVVRQPSHVRWVLVVLVPHRFDASSGTVSEVRGAATDVTEIEGPRTPQGRPVDLDVFLNHGVDSSSDPSVICDVKGAATIVHVNGAFCRRFEYLPAEVLGRDPFFLLFPRRGEELAEGARAALAGEPQPLPVIECFLSRGRRMPFRVVVSFHGDPNSMGLARLTFLAVDPLNMGGPDWVLDAERRQRLDMETLLAASSSIINDFNNLLAIVHNDPSGAARSGMDVSTVVRQARQKAAEAADLLGQMLSVAIRRLDEGAHSGGNHTKASGLEARPMGEPLRGPAPAAHDGAPTRLGAAPPGPVQWEAEGQRREAVAASTDRVGRQEDEVREKMAGLQTEARLRPLPFAAPGGKRPLSPSATGRVEAENRPKAHGEHVLVVDDEPSILSVVGGLLETAGYRVSLCSSGQEALRFLGLTTEGARPDRPDVQLAIVDLQLSDMNGLGLMDLVRSMGWMLPVVFATGYAPGSTAKAIAGMAATRLIDKPFRSHELLDACDALLGRSNEPTHPKAATNRVGKPSESDYESLWL